LFVLVLIFTLLALDPPTVLLVIGVVYVSSGLVVTLLGRQQWKSRRLRRLGLRAPHSDPDVEKPGRTEE
jgi:hypothetical protein